jgi:hypothetical protein
MSSWYETCLLVSLRSLATCGTVIYRVSASGACSIVQPKIILHIIGRSLWGRGRSEVVWIDRINFNTVMKSPSDFRVGPEVTLSSCPGTVSVV